MTFFKKRNEEQRLTHSLIHQGGWESDESIKEAALRESIEEAGVFGTVEVRSSILSLYNSYNFLELFDLFTFSFTFLQRILGKWLFKSKSNENYYEGFMFPLLVKEQLDFWPEKDIRQRIWVSF